jgi:hypothetical protein
MQIIFKDEQERASGKQAAAALLNAGDFLTDAWNQDLWLAIAKSAWDCSEEIALSALREFSGRTRVRKTLRYLETHSGR